MAVYSSALVGTPEAEAEWGLVAQAYPAGSGYQYADEAVITGSGAYASASSPFLEETPAELATGVTAGASATGSPSVAEAWLNAVAPAAPTFGGSPAFSPTAMGSMAQGLEMGPAFGSMAETFDWAPAGEQTQGYQGLATGEGAPYLESEGETAGGSVADVVARQAAERAAMPSAWQSIIGMDTPSDLASDPTTPFNRDPGVGILGALLNLNEATAIPYVTPFLRGQVAPAAGDLAAFLAGSALPTTVINAALDKLGVGATAEDVARFYGESAIPTTGAEIALELMPGIGTVPGVRSFAKQTADDIARAAALRAVTPLDELPEAAARGALGNTLQNPASVGGAVPPRLPGGVMAGGADEAANLPLSGPGAFRFTDEDDALRAVDRIRAETNVDARTDLRPGNPPTYRVVYGTPGGGAVPEAVTGVVPGPEDLDSVIARINQRMIELRPEIGAPSSATPPPSAVPDAVTPQAAPAQPSIQPEAVPASAASGSGGGGLPPQPPPPTSAITPPPSGPSVATAIADAPDPGFAGNIRLSKYPEDIRGTVKGWADANPDLVQDARRGVRSDAQVRADAEALVNDVGGDFNKVQSGWKSGEAWNAEEITAIRGALNDATQKVVTLARAADSTENQLKLAEAILEQQRIQQIVHGVTAEAGRALRAFRQQAGEAAGDVERMQQLIKVATGADNAVDVANLTAAIRALPLDDTRAASQLIRAVNKPGFFDYLYEWWLNSILSGPFTQLRNIIGNAAATATEPVRRGIAAAIDAPLALSQGRQAERFWQEAPASVVGMLQGLPEGVMGAIKTMQTGFNPAAVGRVEVRKTAFTGPAGRIIRTPTTALEAMDAFFSTVNTRMLMNANAVRMARREGLRGEALQTRIAQLLSDPPANLIKQSSVQSEELLFRGDPGDSLRAFMRFRDKAPGLRYIVPFARTPTNLLKFGIQHSPFGALDFNMWRKLAAGNPEGADEMARVILGSTIAAGFGAMVANGTIDITAGVPLNAAERDRFYREGKLPFSIRVPGVGWVQYNQIPVLSESLGYVGSVVQGVRNGESVEDIATQAASSIGQSLLDKSYMSGLSDLIDAIRDPERFAPQFAARQVQGFVPASSAVRQANSVFDTSVRDPESFAERLKVGLPILNQQVPPRLDAFGQEIQRGNSPFSPIAVSAEKQTAVDAELERLGVEVGFVGSTAAGYSLNRTQQDLYQRIAGQATYNTLAALVDLPAYQSLTDAQKEKVIEKVTAESRDLVRDRVGKLTDTDEFGTLPSKQQNQLITLLLQMIMDGKLE